jgi:hypothetical protein
MATKILLLLLFCLSCGREVNLKNNKLESLQQITTAEKQKLEKTGTLNTTSQTVTTNENTYKVSRFSSKNALDFIAAQPAVSQIPIIYIGVPNSDELVLEEIRRR